MPKHPFTTVSGAMLLALLIPLSGCHQASRSATYPGAEPNRFLPEIQSAQSKNGRGIPNGRSDTDEPYLRLHMPTSPTPGFGFTEDAPVKVGRHDRSQPHLLYLNALRGPNGEPVEFERLGACCAFAVAGSDKGGMLDIYRVRIDGPFNETYIFIDMYNDAPLQIPVGFTQRK